MLAGHIHPHTLEPYPAAAPPSGTQTQQASQQPNQPLQSGQQQQPSIAGRRQLGSWVAAGKAQQQQNGLGPSQPLPPPMLQRLQRQWEGVSPRQGGQGQPAGTDMSDVLQSYQPPAVPQQQQQQQHPQAGHAGRMQPAHDTQPQRTGNMFARQQVQQQRQPQPLPPRQSQAATHCGSSSSLQETIAALQPSHASGQPSGQLVGREQPLQPITNQLRQAQQEPAACASSSTSAASSHAQLWDRADQFRPSQQSQQAQQQQQQQQQHQQQQRQFSRGTPPAAAAGNKRKSSGGSGSGGKKAAKPLAPPAQRISRFFTAVPKQK